MKQVVKIILAAAAVAALAVPAMAADKLIVKNAAGTLNAFKVTDAGTVSVRNAGDTADVFSVTNDGTIQGNSMKLDGVTKKFLLGPVIASPIGTLEIRENGTNADRGLVVGQHNNGLQAAPINFYKSRGTATAPLFPALNDYIGAFAGLFWNGGVYDRSAQFGFRNDAAVTAPTFDTGTPPAMVTPGFFPTSIIFWTGSGGTTMKEALRISSSNNVVVGNLGGSATTDLATNVTSGFLFIPNVAGTLTTCATVTPVTGHVPVWFDTVSAKICTCQGATLKCTAAMN